MAAPNTFKNYFLTEESDKNIHMTHAEELPLMQGPAGAENTLNVLSDLVNKLSGDDKGAASLSVKFDGAPAVICGIDPTTKKFFVGTKGVFNKLNPKVNFTEKDIENNYPDSPGLKEKLKTSLKYLSKLGIQGVIQGDMMYSRPDLKIRKVSGEKMVVFKPNTIAYTVPVDSELGDKILQSKMGIVFHTAYRGKSLATMKSGFNLDVSKLKQTPDVWFEDANVKDISKLSIGPGPSRKLRELLSKAQSVSKKIKYSTLMTPKLNQYLLTFGSYRIKNEELPNNFNTFKRYFVSTFSKNEINTLKTEKGRTKKQEILKELVKLIDANKITLTNFFLFQNYVVQVKSYILKQLNTLSKLGTFVEIDGDLVPTAPEGFVAISDHGTVKLVDRLEFSKLNFNLQKNWSK
jgi:hypothetical protein